ncbi:MAG: DUF3240 domain-containing protein [Variovorax paradoxus]|uniref:DUF3240 domain-containing protein n=1 Tax=Variovorax paradoxus TaxID=34073 RepID=A0A2W5QER0_VARPD|nr:MAG: DUF3240 domain-containing protein [Variovorax paradoxus]
MSKQCLTLTCSPSAEEQLLDILLENADCGAFTSVRGYVHGATQETLSASEQVMGRSHALVLQIILEEDVMHVLLERLRTELNGSGIRYWASPVTHTGEIK